MSRFGCLRKAAMNGKTGGNRGPRRAAALAVVAAVAALTAGCGVVHVHFGSSAGSASAEPATYRANLAYAHCMQTHGVPDFPDPIPSARISISISGQPNGNPNSPTARANDACKHLLPAGSTGTGSATTPAAPSPPGAAAADCLAFRPPCYTPRQFRVAYGIQPLLNRGIDGRGVTVALPEEAETGPASGAGAGPGGHRHPAGPGGLRQPVRTAPGTDPGHPNDPGGHVRLAVAGQRGGGGGHRAGARRRPGRHHP